MVCPKVGLSVLEIKSVCLRADCFAFGDLLLKSTKSKQKCLLLVWPLVPRGSLTPTTLRGPAPNGHPCPSGALAASMPLGPLRVVYIRPAPKSRLAVTELFVHEDQKRVLSRSKASRLKPVLPSEPISIDACAALVGPASREEVSPAANNFADSTSYLWERARSRMLYSKHQKSGECTDPFVSKLTPTNPPRLICRALPLICFGSALDLLWICFGSALDLDLRTQ